MTAKEKAAELVEKFYSQKGKFQQIKYWRWDMAKDCAIIAVEEIMGTIDAEDHVILYNYWQKVKKEIETL